MELINRTNQLNSSGERLSDKELRSMVADKENYCCLQLSCVDKFGDYGIVGFCIVNVKDKTRAVCEHFVLSCRAAKKKIEQSFFEFLIRWFKDKGFAIFAVQCTQTSKNNLLLSCLTSLDYFTKTVQSENKFVLTATTNKPINFIDIVHVINK
jgi:FkbH-like protein